MRTNEYIKSRFEKILIENLNEKADAILKRLNYDEEAPFNPEGDAFDYVQESSKGMCEQCGGEMMESECMECGWKNEGEIMELGGMEDAHPIFGNINLKNLSRKEIDKIMRNMNDDDDFEEKIIHHDDDNDDWDEIDLDVETDWEQLDEDECTECEGMYEEEIDEKLYGKQYKLDKNKNGRIDREDFKKLRSMDEDVEPLYEVEFDRIDEKWEGDVEVKQTGEYSDMSIEELNAAIKKQKAKNDKVKEAGKKVSHADRTKMSQLYFAKRAKQGWKGKGKAKVSESIYFTENELISLIEEMVNEDKKFRMGEPKGYKEYEKVHSADKKENEDYLKSVAKKMTDYLKNASDKGSKYEMKETEKFPTENGGKRKKYTPSQAVDEYIDAFSYPGQTNLVYDEIKPNDERIEKYLKGDSTTGNAQVDKDGKALGNVVPSEVGEKFFKNYKDNLYGQEQQQASYKRQTQPVDQAGEVTERGSLKSKKGKKTAQGVLNKLEESNGEKEVIKLTEEYIRMQTLMNYTQKTQ